MHESVKLRLSSSQPASQHLLLSSRICVCIYTSLFVVLWLCRHRRRCSDAGRSDWVEAQTKELGLEADETKENLPSVLWRSQDKSFVFSVAGLKMV